MCVVGIINYLIIYCWSCKGTRGPPTSGAPPVSGAQNYSQFGQGENQNGPPPMGAPPQRSVTHHITTMCCFFSFVADNA